MPDKKPRPISPPHPRRVLPCRSQPKLTPRSTAASPRPGFPRHQRPRMPSSSAAPRSISPDRFRRLPRPSARSWKVAIRRKRQTLIDDLLADPAYGRRFGAVWKRLIAPRPASNGKPQVDKVTPWLAEQFNRNRGWNEVVSELLTTEANVAREPQGYFLAVNSESFEPKPNLLAASTARLFLGVQLACAECHNHPFADWKQTEFWNLAAFFSKVHKRSKSDPSWTEEPTDPPRAATITIPEGGEGAGTLVPARFLGGVEPASRPVDADASRAGRVGHGGRQSLLCPRRGESPLGPLLRPRTRRTTRRVSTGFSRRRTPPYSIGWPTSSSPRATTCSTSFARSAIPAALSAGPAERCPRTKKIMRC